MARKNIYTKEMILNSAVKIFKENGYSAITAKNIAKELNCSVAPIYTIYMSIDDLKKDLNSYIKNSLLDCEEEKSEADFLLSHMFDKLNIDRKIYPEISHKLKNFKENLSTRDKVEIFSEFSNLIQFFYKNKIINFKRSEILSIIMKHKDYISTFSKK